MILTLAKTLSKIAFLPCAYHLDTEAEIKAHLRLKPFEASPPCRPHAMQVPRAGPLVLGAVDRTMGHGRKSSCAPAHLRMAPPSDTAEGDQAGLMGGQGWGQSWSGKSERHRLHRLQGILLP